MERLFECCLSVLWVLLELLCVLKFSDIFMSQKPKTLWHIATLLVVWITNSILACLEIDATIRRSFTFLGAFAIVTLMHKGTWLHRVLIIVVAYIYISILDI